MLLIEIIIILINLLTNLTQTNFLEFNETDTIKFNGVSFFIKKEESDYFDLLFSGSHFTTTQLYDIIIFLQKIMN